MVFSIRRVSSGVSAWPAGAAGVVAAAFGGAGAGAADWANEMLAIKATNRRRVKNLKITKNLSIYAGIALGRLSHGATVRRGRAAMVWLFSALKLLDQQHSVHRPGAEPFQIQSHKFKSQCFED